MAIVLKTIAERVLDYAGCRKSVVFLHLSGWVRFAHTVPSRKSAVLQASVVDKTIAMRKAFTLAEVLIVLGIIGLIADMTIPTLINSTQKKTTTVKVKKFYSTMTQAMRLSESENGQRADWDYGSSYDAESSNKFFNTYFAPYLNIIKDFENSPDGCTGLTIKHLDGFEHTWHLDKWHFAMLSDGSCLSIITGLDGILNIGIASVDYDVNGPKKPNQLGKDRFRFDVSPVSEFMPQYMEPTREELIATNGKCAKDKTGEGTGCARLMMFDGWEIGEDYPW